MVRTALVYVLPATLVVTGWLALEDPPAAGRAIAVALLAVLPALVRPAWLRTLAALAVSAAAAWIALGVSIFTRGDFFGPIGSRFGTGFGEYYDVVLPFDPGAHPHMHQALLAGIFVFCLALGLAIAARRALLASLTLVVAAGWPATLLPGGAALARGALLLGGVLLLFAALRRTPGRRPAEAVLAGAVVIACALAASTAPAIAKGEFLHWESWDLRGSGAKPVGVAYVWNSSYDGLNWPKKVTTVLRIHSDQVQRYWRATTLDAFRGGRWLEDLVSVYPLTIQSPGRDTLPSLRFLPPRARNPATWVRQDVTVENLRDSHLVGAAVPVGYDHHEFGGVTYESGGVATVSPGLSSGKRYTVWSYAAHPSPDRLARAKPVYPGRIGTRELGIGRGSWVPPFGSPGRARIVEGQIGDARVPAVYERVFRLARSTVGRAESPYAAVVAIESWFRSGGGFAYDDHPPRVRGVPPLAAFVLDTRRGYCQHFAGAMALMLRYLGIPARVAVGFTSGDYDRKARTWIVTDHDAHAWVEVWFRGYGWLPFDPTPGRGQLGARYSSSSRAFDASGAAALLRGAAKGVRSALENRARAEERARGGSRFSGEAITLRGGGAKGFVARATSRGASLLKLLALIAAGLLAAVLVVKFLRRRVRYLTHDPRRLAAACRRELHEFLADQGVELPSSATLGELELALDEEFGVDGTAFAAAAGRARFGVPADACDWAAAGREELKQLRWVLRRRLRTSERLRGAFSLRSLRSA